MNPTTAPRRILRSRSERILGGVAGGFADYLNVDPVLIRLAFVALSLLGGVGALLYLVAWLIVPEAADPGDRPEPAVAPDEGGSRAKPMVPVWAGISLLVLLVFVGGFRHVGFGLDGQVLWPFVLILFGAAILWSRAGSGRPPVNRPGPPPGTGDATTVDGTIHDSTADASPVGPEGAPATEDPGTTAGMELARLRVPAAVAPAAPGLPRPSVRPSPIRRAAPVIGRIVLALVAAAIALVVTALAVLLFEGREVLVVTPTEALLGSIGVAAVAVGLGILWHRVPDLLVVAAAVILVLGVAAWLRPPLRGGIGDREVRPVDAGALGPAYELGIGKLRLDLRGVEPAARARSVKASVAVGVVEIVVPRDVTVHFRGRVSAGQVCAFGRRNAGTDNDVRSTVRRAAAATGTGVLNVDAHVGVGEVHIGRTAAEAARGCAVADDGSRPGGPRPPVTP